MAELVNASQHLRVVLPDASPGDVIGLGQRSVGPCEKPQLPHFIGVTSFILALRL
jgi:hypothetical protein